MRETSGLELASIITIVLQANQLTKCASHPIITETFNYADNNCVGSTNTQYSKGAYVTSCDQFVTSKHLIEY